MCSRKRNNIFGTVTFHLTLWYVGLFATLSLAVSGLFYFRLTSRLMHQVDMTLREEVKEVDAIYKTRTVEQIQKEFVIEAESVGMSRMFLLLISPEHEVLAASDLTAWKGLDLASLPPAGVAHAEETFETLSIPGREHNVRAVYKKNEDRTVVVIGFSLEDNEKLIESYREIFGTGLAIMLMCGGLFGWLVARRAMAGVQRVTQTAVRIGKGDLAKRVPVGHEGKEISDLAMAFNEMLERIQMLVGELKDVTNNIAHDLRSPLTRIRGNAETTLTGGQSIEEYREMAAMVVEESDRLVNMINTMLEIAEADSGVNPIRQVPVDVVEIVKNAYELFQPVAEDKGVHFKIDAPAQALYTLGEVAPLQRVVANLLDNAIKYTAGGGTVTLSAKENREHVSISVIDSGSGIAEKDLPHIFDRFYRGDQSRSTPGSGLGLSLAQAVIRAHGGNIAVKSIPGSGSAFTILLPRGSHH